MMHIFMDISWNRGIPKSPQKRTISVLKLDTVTWGFPSEFLQISLISSWFPVDSGETRVGIDVPIKYHMTQLLGIFHLQIWGFPRIGVPLVLIHFYRFVPEINHPAIGGTPMASWKPQNILVSWWYLVMVSTNPQLARDICQTSRTVYESTLWKVNILPHSQLLNMAIESSLISLLKMVMLNQPPVSWGVIVVISHQYSSWWCLIKWFHSPFWPIVINHHKPLENSKWRFPES